MLSLKIIIFKSNFHFFYFAQNIPLSDNIKINPGYIKTYMYNKIKTYVLGEIFNCTAAKSERYKIHC